MERQTSVAADGAGKDGSAGDVQSGRNAFRDGLKTGIPIAVGYIPIAIAFGVLAKGSAIPNDVTILMSLLIYAGASQFVGVNLLGLGTAHWEIVMTTFILNLRHFLMTAAVSQRVSPALSWKRRALLAFGVTDETFTIGAMRKERELDPQFLFGLHLIAYTAWNVGTWAGVFLSAGLPTMLQASMGIALYAMFIGILVPSLKTSRPALVACLFAVCMSSILHWLPVFKHLSTGWQIIIATVVSSAAGAVLFSEKEEPK